MFSIFLLLLFTVYIQVYSVLYNDIDKENTKSAHGNTDILVIFIVYTSIFLLFLNWSTGNIKKVVPNF